MGAAPVADPASYTYVAGRRVPLERDPEVFAVRFAVQHTDNGTFEPSNRSLLDDESELTAVIEPYRLQVRRTSGTGSRNDSRSSAERLARTRALNDEPDVELAAQAYRRRPGATDLMFVTRRFVVRFRPEIDAGRISDVNDELGVRTVEPAGYMPASFVLEAPSGDGAAGPVALANYYIEHGLALVAAPDFVRRLYPRSGPVTPAGPFVQWHLETARVPSAWELTRGSPDVAVAVLDDGVDTEHVEFTGRVLAQIDVTSRAADARPRTPTENHGTACAGVAVAAGHRTSGAAPGCSLIAARTPSFLGTVDEAEMFRWAADSGADVISCSWGPEDGTGARDLLPDHVRAALRYCVTDGRGGRGIPIFWAAGNGGESVSLDGYASNPDVIAVAATTSRDKRAPYSDFGPEIWVCAPSSGLRDRGDRDVVTTDRSGPAGYDLGLLDPSGDYTGTFGGTSSAAPLVAGVAALALSANPELTHTQVRELLRASAVRVGDPSSYDTSGHSPLYGFGRVDARRAVELALGGGVTPRPEPAAGTPRPPAVTAPASLNRSGPPPEFTVDLGSSTVCAVEVAARWQLLTREHRAERAGDEFWASWQDGPLVPGPTVTMPDPAWQRLRTAQRLYYRVQGAQDADWTGRLVSVADRDASSAPFVDLTGDGPEPAGPSITGPAEWPRGGDPPAFVIDTDGAPLFAVEVAVDWRLFDPRAGGADRGPTTFHASWADGPLLSGSTFDLPAPAWRRLRAAERLFYRVHVAQDAAWGGRRSSVSDVDASTAPFLLVLPD